MSAIIQSPSPLAELRDYLCGIADEFRSARKFHELTEVQTVQDIATDDSKRLGIAGGLLLAAEQQDLNAADIIERILADGKVEAVEMPLLRNALALIKGSAVNDHKAVTLVTA